MLPWVMWAFLSRRQADDGHRAATVVIFKDKPSHIEKTCLWADYTKSWATKKHGSRFELRVRSSAAWVKTVLIQSDSLGFASNKILKVHPSRLEPKAFIPRHGMDLISPYRHYLRSVSLPRRHVLGLHIYVEIPT